MQYIRHFYFMRNIFSAIVTACVIACCVQLTACGGGGGGAEVEARAQTISFGAVPVLNLGSTATVTASASSGLSIKFSSDTPTICSIDSASGLVTALMPGTCIIAANQSGNSTYAPASEVTQNIAVIFDPNQTISFTSTPTLTFAGTATVSATATSGLPVTYSSATTSICTVDSNSGLVTNLTAGTCTIVANQSGDANYYAAPSVSLNLIVDAPIVITAPDAPASVTATLGSAGNTIIITAGSISSGGSAITAFTATSSPAGLTATSASLPITIHCTTSCSGYAFTLTATNSVGTSAPSSAVDVITQFNVTTRFYEPDTQPRDSIFTGTFTFNSTTRTVSNLTGLLTESMTGDPYGTPPNYGMTQLSLTYQLDTLAQPSLNGVLVTTFSNSNKNTFWTMGGTNDGWSPETGVAVGGIYFGFPTTAANPSNAYTRIFVNTENPLSTITQSQIDKLAYADCAPGGMMGAACMTGTNVAGYGAIGTMSGYPISQTVSKQ